MGHSNYRLTDDQTKKLDEFAKQVIDYIERELTNDIGGILDPYEGRKFNNDKFTAMVWYIGDKIAFY